ncbi:MAG: ATP-binding protein [Acidobacteria bacterium]|nr:ATP-binding protein [Chloroflexota bacterium]MYN65302.1 ATP-binding protein [Acidobacteriota bacterium]
MAIEREFLRPPSGHFFLFGPRGTGKSTWLQATFPNAARIDLLAPAQQRLYAARPERLRELAAAPGVADLVIDEVQRVPELLTVVHQLTEESGRPRFVLTGSSARKLKRSGVDLLAGRAVVRSMHPFMAALGPRFDLAAALDQGLLPLIWDAGDPADTLSAYAGLYVQQEVQTEGLVRDLGAFHRFLEAISFSHSAVLNTSDVARECAVRRKTVEGFIEIVEDLLLAFRLPVFTRRARRQVTAHPKFYFADAGVFRSLRPAGPLDRPQEASGAALEGLVAQHLRAWIDYSGAAATLAFWRTRAGSEVDFVLYGRDVFWALEVKHAARIRPADLRSLKSFARDYPEAQPRLAYLGDERLRIDGILCVPVTELLHGIVPGKPLP